MRHLGTVVMAAWFLLQPQSRCYRPPNSQPGRGWKVKNCLGVLGGCPSCTILLVLDYILMSTSTYTPPLASLR